MSLHQIEQLLKARIGLDAASIGASAVSGAVNRRMSACGLNDPQRYIERVNSSQDELTQLIETIVVPETWFFRDGKPFQALNRFARERAGSVGAHDPLRALSLPCSTGEEPYSMAITLLTAGLSPGSFRVDGIDVSHCAIEYAKSGDYGSHSFRGRQDPRVLERYFMRDETRYRISDQVKTCVNFQQGNILSDDWSAMPRTYDVIFCRNLLIYFAEQEKKRAFTIIREMLKDDGLLFVGHAEYGSVPADMFDNAGYSECFAFKKGSKKRPQSEPISNSAPIRIPETVQRPSRRPDSSRAAPRPFADVVEPNPDPVPASSDGHADELELARQLADMGRLQEASEICGRFLGDAEHRGQAYFLQGLIDMASEDPEQAERHFRKAIYLDPKHYEALIHLSLLLAQQGDTAGAALLRKRAERVCPSAP